MSMEVSLSNLRMSLRNLTIDELREVADTALEHIECRTQGSYDRLRSLSDAATRSTRK